MNKDRRQFLQELLDTPSPSGFEQKAQSVVRRRLGPLADEVVTDVHGNVMAVLNRGGSPRVMICGHCDEIGLMITHIDDKGFCYFDRIGGTDTACILGSRVKVLSAGGPVLGVIGKKPVHVEKPDERGKGVKPEDLTSLFIDIGAHDGKEANKRVAVGDPAVYDVGFAELAGDRFIARGVDDRVGAFVACEVLAELKTLHARGKLSAEVWAVSSVQEEVGLRGAKTAAFAIDPQVGFAVDVNFATDHPGMEPKSHGLVKLGGGPTLGRGGNTNPVLEKLVVDTAAKKKIRLQRVAEPRIPGTDAAVIQVNGRGAAAAIIGIPNRYMHTPVEMAAYDDLAAAIDLLTAAVAAIKKDHDFTPR